MIGILFAPPRTGKTCLMTHMANMAAFDRQRNRAMQLEIMNKRANGFDGIQTIPVHCVSANYDMTMRKFGYRPRLNRRINPYRLGFANEFVETHFTLPYEFICIDEAQGPLDSHMAMYYPRWQSSWYEQSGHNNLDILLATQRPMLINANIRELAYFMDVVKLDKWYDDFGKVKRLRWRIRRLDNSGLFDRYMASGKQDKSLYEEDTITADYNVFDCYDSQSCKPKFYAGHMDEDFDYNQAEVTDETFDGYLRFLREHDDELPDNFYLKRKAA